MNAFGGIRSWLRRKLGIAAIQRQIRDLEGMMAISKADIERLNAATSRIAARVASLLDQIDALGTGNDDEVRAQAQQEAIQQASADLRPVIEQLETLGADADAVVPEPAPEQVPVEPGPDVTPVENLETVEEGEATAPEPTDTPVAEEPVTEPVAEEPVTEPASEEPAPVTSEEVPAADVEGGATSDGDDTNQGTV